jgi:hypothetical protein
MKLSSRTFVALATTRQDSEPHVLDWTLGGLIHGRGLKGANPQTPLSAAPVTAQLVSICPLATSASPRDGQGTVASAAEATTAMDTSG